MQYIICGTLLSFAFGMVSTLFREATNHVCRKGIVGRGILQVQTTWIISAIPSRKLLCRRGGLNPDSLQHIKTYKK
jgi:hypothetical protein